MNYFSISFPAALRTLWFEKTKHSVYASFPVRINQVCAYGKKVKAGKQLSIRRVLVLAAGKGVKIRPIENETGRQA